MMRIPGILLTAVVLLTLVGCGGDTHEAVVEDALDNTEKITEILAGVDDVASAEAAADEITALAPDMREVFERAAALEPLSEEETDALKAQFEERNEQVSEALADQMSRIGALGMDVMMPIIEAFKQLEEAADSSPNWMK